MVTTPPAGSRRHSQWLPPSPPADDRTMSRGHARAFKTLQRRWIPQPEDPLGHANRTLVLCFDGTGDQFDDDVGAFIVSLTYGRQP